MAGSLDLNGIWRLSWTEGLHGRPDHGVGGEVDAGRYLEAPVPCEIHQVLQQQGLLEDPRVGLNSLRARWVEEQIWLYRRTFTAPPEALSQPAWLVFEQLDLQAVIYLNGREIGRHGNAHRPCRLAVGEALQAGENTLAVVLESGLYDVAERPGRAYNTALETLLNKRHWMRKAQYQAGWDWNPRLINVGITGDVRLEWSDRPWIEELVLLPELSPDLRQGRCQVRAFVFNPLERPVPGVLRVQMAEAEVEATVAAELPPGETRLEAVLEVPHPRLWWPVGHGEQALYTVTATLSVEGAEVSQRARRTGLRTVRLWQEPHPEKGRYFILEVSGRPIFCKGGNWVPPDLIPSGVDRSRYEALADLAVAANCNMLRVWGGGVYLPPAMLEACDERGLLVWHDLLFACSKYPADDPEFMAEVRREVTWAVRSRASHPCLAVWCGNNELEWGAWEWGYDAQGKALPDYSLYHHVLPVILQAEDPSRPYWPSSPYSLDHQPPNDPTTGDQHPWNVTLGPYGEDFWHYRHFIDRFPNEGGILGASSPATLRQCLGDGLAFRSPAWEHHDNAANFWRPGQGITYRTVSLWLGRPAESMSLEDYCFASALLQAEGLAEYIANYRRRMFSSAAAVFWMYNDSWPATHGWSIVDYYLRRKLAYHPVRRAFAPVTVVVAEEGERILVFGVNDSPEAWAGQLGWGLFGLAGGRPVEEWREVSLPPNASTLLAEIPWGEWERLGWRQAGAFAVLQRDGRTVAQHRLFRERFAHLNWAPPSVVVKRQGDRAVFWAEAFVWGGCLDLDGEADVADNAFDLLPGLDYAVPWPADAPDPVILRCGNDLFLR